MKTPSSVLLLLPALVACEVDYDLNRTDRAVTAPQAEWIDHQLHDKGPITDLDVLVVLDGSGSMSDDLENVGRGLLQLKHDIQDRADDWSISFITADPAEPGVVGPIRPGDADIDLVMAPALLPVTGAEKAFASSYHFLHSHPDWIHGDRDLLIFMISDEDEQSNVTPELYDEWLNSLKTGGRQADVVSIASTEAACSPDIGHKYKELATLRGNRVVDLCADSWVEWLSEYSFLTAFSPRIPREPPF